MPRDATKLTKVQERYVALAREGLSITEIAARVGRTQPTVSHALSVAEAKIGISFPRFRGRPKKDAPRKPAAVEMEDLDDVEENERDGAERCRCGLRAPCFSCIPASAVEYLRAQDADDRYPAPVPIDPRGQRRKAA